jgi:hypothetical protein
MKKVLGMFGKGTDGSVTINFGLSGGRNCSRKCRHHPRSKAGNPTKGCYAIAVEKRGDRAPLAAKLDRLGRMAPAMVVGRALYELQAIRSKGASIPWVRFSSNGSLPNRADASALFVTQLRTLCLWCKQNEIPIHFPVESPEKARFYREVLNGTGVVVRESLQSASRITETSGPVSFVAGDEIRDGKAIRQKRHAEARRLAKLRYEATGERTIVCPAVTSSWDQRAGKRKGKIRCGECDACANPELSVVYPFH